MPLYLKILVAMVCVAAIIDIAWVIAFRLGQFRGALENALHKELFLRRALLRLPGSLTAFLGVTIVYVGASAQTPSTTTLLILGRLGFFSGVACMTFSISAMIWYFTQLPVPIWLVPKWAQPEIRSSRAKRAGQRSTR